MVILLGRLNSSSLTFFFSHMDESSSKFIIYTSLFHSICLCFFSFSTIASLSFVSFAACLRHNPVKRSMLIDSFKLQNKFASKCPDFHFVPNKKLSNYMHIWKYYQKQLYINSDFSLAIFCALFNRRLNEHAKTLNFIVLVEKSMIQLSVSRVLLYISIT